MGLASYRVPFGVASRVVEDVEDAGRDIVLNFIPGNLSIGLAGIFRHVANKGSVHLRWFEEA